jgi:hypothetical protein
MSRSIKTLALCLVLSTGANAELILPETQWTESEHASLLALDAGCNLIELGYRRYFNPNIEDFLAERDNYSQVLQNIVSAWGTCLQSLQALYGMAGASPREGKGLVVTTISQLEALVLPRTIDPRWRTWALRSLEEFDPMLSYANRKPTTYPRTVGPHGDYDWSLARLADFQDEIMPAAEALAKLIHSNETPVMSWEALTQIAKSARRLSLAIKASRKSAGLTAYVIDKRDGGKISADTEDTGGARAEDFFRGTLALEHLTGKHALPMFSERNPAPGMLAALFPSAQLLDTLNRGGEADLVSLEGNGPQWLLGQLDGGPLQVFRKHVFGAWQHADNYVFGMMGFFHPSTVPPVLVPPGPMVLEGPLMPEAPWSQSEFESLLQLQYALELATEAVVAAIGERNTYAAQTIAIAGKQLSGAMWQLLNVERYSADDRASTVARAVSNIGKGQDRALSVTAPGGSQTRALVDQISVHIGAFDTSLDYLDWQPSDYPTVIGPHGDYARAQRELAHATLYQWHVLWDLARLMDPELTPEFPDAELGELQAIADLTAQATRATLRAQALEGFIVTPEDWELLRRDTLAASGLRPPSFFRSILALEYTFSKPGDTPLNNAGRESVPESFPNALAEAMMRLLDLAPRLAELNGGGPWMAERMQRDGIIIGNARNEGLLAEAYQDAYDLWAAVDHYGWSVIGFFHGVPLPPGAGTRTGTDDDLSR